MKIEISDTRKWQYSSTLKMLLLVVFGVFLLIPLELIKEVIKERQKNSEKVKKEIAIQWASAQNLSGPVLNIPVLIKTSEKNTEPVRKVFHIMPENLHIEGVAESEKRHRSIYNAVVYTADITVSGDFIVPEFPGIEKSEPIMDESYFSIGITDNRGLKGAVSLKTDSAVIEAVPGLRDTDLFSSGITFPIGLKNSGKRIPFNVTLKISGSENISFAPVGKTTDVNIRSSWNSPGFSGNFLPVERTINSSGFTARWIVTNLNRNFPQVWSGSAFKPENDSFGVDFVLQVDHYLKSLRSAKYGILFIALTFLAMLFAEMSTRKKISIFHYMLTALALVLFFSLLNALSEHTGFNLAYMISSVSVIALISLFLKPLIVEQRPLLMITGVLIVLYTFIYILLTLNDYAYLAGNIGLFIMLAITMAVSVRLNASGKDFMDN